MPHYICHNSTCIRANTVNAYSYCIFVKEKKDIKCLSSYKYYKLLAIMMMTCTVACTFHGPILRFYAFGYVHVLVLPNLISNLHTKCVAKLREVPHTCKYTGYLIPKDVTKLKDLVILYI